VASYTASNYDRSANIEGISRSHKNPVTITALFQHSMEQRREKIAGFGLERRVRARAETEPKWDSEDEVEPSDIESASQISSDEAGSEESSEEVSDSYAKVIPCLPAKLRL
jgi:hypothetical protein